MNKSTKTSQPQLVAIPNRLRWIAPLTLALISTSLSGCKEIVVISADQTETFVKANQAFVAPDDGFFLPVARYQRYRRAVADKIQDLQTNQNFSQ